MPLVSLYPDPNEQTALDIALDKNPRCFELLINLLEPFDNFCISKMMLKSFPSMI